MSKLKFLLNKLASQLWVRPACYSMAALFWVFLGTVAEYFLQGSRGIDISRETLVNLFSILASTMLTVAIFSVSAIAAAYASVSTTAAFVMNVSTANNCGPSRRPGSSLRTSASTTIHADPIVGLVIAVP